MKNNSTTEVGDVVCPHCGTSLMFPNPDPEKHMKINGIEKTKIFLIGKNGLPFERVLVFSIVGPSSTKGFLELSPMLGDYSKYSSLPLRPEDEITMLCPWCHKNLKETSDLVKLLVKNEGPGFVEHYIVPKYGIEVTLCVDQGKFKSKYGSETFKSVAEYFEKKLKEYNSRK